MSGVVLIADIASKVIAKDRALERVNVYEIMTKPIISVHPDMDIRYMMIYILFGSISVVGDIGPSLSFFLFCDIC
jgi:CBS domain-containing protein